jgi:hypothetical protein
MINDNIDVHNGIANGTTAEFALYQTRCKTCSNSNVWLLGYSVKVDEVDSWAIEVVGFPTLPYKLSFQ